MLVVDLQVDKAPCHLFLLSSIVSANHISKEMDNNIDFLQGVKEKGVFLLTDPAIHSAVGDFGRDNKRAMGIAKFFETHVCNSICEELKLTKQK